MQLTYESYNACTLGHKESKTVMNGLSVIFDLDGTMVDTAPDLVIAANKTLDAFHIDTVDESIIKKYVGLGSKPTLRAALDHLGYKVSTGDLDAMVTYFVTYYRDNIAVESRVFPGLELALQVLQERGARLGVCTNKREQLSLELLEALNLRHYFGAVVGADTLTVRKPDPEHLLETIARVRGNRENAIMIGDSETDAKTARAAGIPFIAVSFGYRNCALADLGADAVIDHYDDLINAISGLIRL